MEKQTITKLVIDVDTELHKSFRMACFDRGVTMKSVVTDLIAEKIKQWEQEKKDKK